MEELSKKLDLYIEKNVELEKKLESLYKKVDQQEYKIQEILLLLKIGERKSGSLQFSPVSQALNHNSSSAPPPPSPPPQPLDSNTETTSNNNNNNISPPTTSTTTTPNNTIVNTTINDNSSSQSTPSNPSPIPSPTWSRPRLGYSRMGSNNNFFKKEDSKEDLFYIPPLTPKHSKSPSVDSITTIIPSNSNDSISSLVGIDTDKLPNLPDNCKWAVVWEYSPNDDEWTRGVIAIEMEKRPFAKGALRNAYKLHIRMNPIDHYKHFYSASHDKYQEGKRINTSKIPSLFGPVDTLYVAKDSLTKSQATFNHYFDDVKMQMMCREFGDRYNSNHPPKKIEFLSAWVIEVQQNNSSKEPTLYGLELFMNGDFQKQNSNYGTVFSDRNTPQAFSHFTYECSAHDLLVVDIQGVDDFYTDPQIHTQDGKGFGQGNLGIKGIDRFLSSHKCNPICIQFELPPIGVVLNDARNAHKVIRGTMLLPDLTEDLDNTVVYPNIDKPSDVNNSELQLTNTLTGHDQRITCLLVNQDQSKLYSSSADGLLRIWDLNTLQVLESFKAHRRSIESMCINDKYLFTSSVDESIRVWDINNITDCKFKLEEHSGEVNDICIDPINQYLISCSFDKSIKIWDLNTMTCIKTLNAHSKSVKSLFISGKYLFSSSNDSTIKLWDLDMKICIYGFEAHDSWVQTLALYSNNRFFSGAKDGTVKEWSLSTFLNNFTLDANNGTITDLLVTEGFLFIASEDSTIKICDLSTMKIIYSLKAHRSGVQSLCTDGKRIFSGGCDNQIKVWSWKDK